MTGPRPESEADRRARIQRELAMVTQAVREGRLPQGAVERYVERERITPEMEAARTPLTGLEQAGGAIGSAVQGATFNLGDEIGGTLSGLGSGVANLVRGRPADFGGEIGAGIDEQRQQVGQFREAHPVASLGLELAGGLATGLGAAKVAGAGATGLTMAQRAARVAASGAGGGALAGYGSGEGGPLDTERLARGGAGGLAGAAIGAAAPVVAKGYMRSVAGSPQAPVDLLETIAGRASSPFAAPVAGRVGDVLPSDVPRGTPTGFSPKGVSEAAQQATKRAIGNTGAARDLLAQLEAGGMGDEALLMNVGGDRAVRAVRAAANTPMSDAGQLVNERLARQGGALGAQVPRDIGKATGFGTEYPEVTAKRMQDELAAKVEAGYDAFRALPEVPLDPTDPAQKQFIEQYVDPVIRNRFQTATATGQSALSGRNVDAAFKNLQREVRGASTGVALGNKGVNEAQGLESLRDRVRAAISQTDPNYADLARTYAVDEDVGKVAQEAFARGRGLRSPGEAVVAMEETGRVPGAQKALRAGDVARLQESARGRASNPDLGDLAQFRDVARAVVGTVRDKEQFVALHGQDAYDKALEMLMPKIRAAAQNAAARGNSTTTKQLLDALAFGDDAVIDQLNSLTTGGTSGVIRNVLGRAIQPADRAVRLGVGQTATAAADLLTTKGSQRINTVLDLLDALGIEDEAAKRAALPAAGAVSGRAATKRERP